MEVVLIITPTQNSIDNKRVEEYKEQILRGFRPVIILLHVENSWMFYILDGHHKFCAYGKANIKPHAIIITKKGNDYKTIEETIQLAKAMKCTKDEYINQMTSEKKNFKSYKGKKLDLEKTFKLLE